MTRAPKVSPHCAALNEVTEVGEGVIQGSKCMLQGKPKRPLCEAHVLMLEFSDLYVVGDNGVIYKIGKAPR